MWTQVRRSLLLGAAVLVAAAHAQNAGAGSGSDVLVAVPINIDGSLRDLQLLRGESIENAAISFARTNGLMNQDDSRVREVIDQLSGLLKGKVAEIEANAPPSQTTATPTVQLAFPITVDGYTGEVRKHEGESVDAAAERFLYETGFSMDVMRELFPQIVAVLNEKLAELQPARKELFTFELTIDGTPVTVRHFDSGSVTEEAIATLRSLNVGDGEIMDRAVPQIANAIQQQIDARASPPQPQVPAAPEAPAPAAPKELFSIPLTINDRAAVLVHAEGRTTRESALRFLTDNGITDPATINSYLPQVVEIIDERMREHLRVEAEAKAAAATAAPAPPVAPEAPVTERRRLLSLAINLGDNRSADLEYFDGDSVERTVELFLQNVGLADSPSFADTTAQLAGEVRQRLANAQRDEAEQQTQQQEQEEQERLRQRELDAQAAANLDPIISLPVTLSGKTYRLEYYAGQEPTYVATTFCVEKHELVRAELGVEFDGHQLQDCKAVILQTLTNLLAQREPAAAPTQPSPTTTTTTTRSDLLFTLDIDDGDGGSFQLPFHRNDDAETVARAFCERYGIDLSNVPALVQGIDAQLVQR